MNADKSSQHTPTEADRQGRNSAMDKTDTARAQGDPYANQGGGKLGGGNENSGHPANNVIAPRHRHDANPEPAAPATGAPSAASGAGERGTRGSGMPVQSGAGELADDRPGRNAPKGTSK